MKTIALFLVSLFTWIGCEDTVTTSGPERTSAALLSDNIAVDGCSLHFEINSGETTTSYAINAGSEKIVADFLKDIPSQSGVYALQVTLRYKETGSIKAVQCGWGKKQEMKEIEIVSIKPLEAYLEEK